MSINRDRKMVGDVQDRGALKWTALMLPEHIRMLREWKEEDNRVPKPELDEWDMQLIQEEIEIAIKRQCDGVIQTWKDRQFHYYEGVIIGVDLKNRILFLKDKSITKKINLDEIVAVKSRD